MGNISHRLLAIAVAGALAAVSMAQPPEIPVRMTAATDRCADLAEQRDLGTLPLRKEPQASRPVADGPPGAPLRPRVKPRKPAGLAFDPVVHTGRIVLKLADDEGFGVDAVGALTAAVPERAARVAAAIDQVLGPTDIARIFTRREIDLAFERLCGERWIGSEMPDLSQFFLLRPVEKTDSTQLEAMVGDLTTLPYIESVYFEGRSAPPAIGGAATAQKLETLENLQGYLGPAPWGIDARFAWTSPGGTGAHARVWDIEIGWNLNHEDLPAPFMLLGTPGAVPKWTRHGTAVLGILGARLNGIGVVGIARDAAFGLSASDEENATVPAAINLALANSLPYDIILIERQIAGPLIQVQEPGEACGEFSSGRAMVAAEYDDAVFAAIQVAVANRGVVVESAGNGASDLGGPEFVGR